VGDDAAVEARFRHLYDAFYRRVLGYTLRRTPSPAAAEDVVAEVFLIAWRRIGDVPEVDDEAIAWLFGVTRRVMANTRRGDARRDRLVERLRRRVPPEIFVGEVEASVIAGDEHRAILAAVGRLRAEDAEVLQLIAWEQLSHQQAAVVLDCSVNAVAIRVHRARQRLTEELAKACGPTGHNPSVTNLSPTEKPGLP
jgi:RNA polymerase sigma factor (sigma-70 family)